MTYQKKKLLGNVTGYIICKHLTHIGYIVTSSNLPELYLMYTRILGQEVREIGKKTNIPNS